MKRWSWLAWVASLALLCAGCADAVSGHPVATPVPAQSSGQSVHQSMVNLSEAGVLHYKGSMVVPTGQTVNLDVNATAAGEFGGTISANNQQGTLVELGGTLYIDATSAFWSALAQDPGTRAQAVDGRWVKVPDVVLGLQLDQTLAPRALGDKLSREVDTSSGPTLSSLPMTVVNGAKAVKVPIGDGTVYVAAQAPYGVLHVDVPADLGSATKVSLDVTDDSANEAAVYQGLSQQAQQLRTPVETDVDIQQGDQSWGACAATGCSVTVSLTNGGTIPVKVLVDGAWTGDGQPVGTCEAIVGPVPAGQSTTATCTDGTPAWTAFFNRANSTPGTHPYEVAWTAQALADPPNLSTLSAETTAAGKPAAQDGGPNGGTVAVYVIHYQDSGAHQQVWKYGVGQNRSWRADSAAQLPSCLAASGTSCTASLVTTTASRPAADALTAQLVNAVKSRSGRCPPGQWTDCG